MVSSSIEVKDLKNKMPKDFIFVTPGIQLSDTNNDQKRTSSPLSAKKWFIYFNYWKSYY